MAKPKPKGPPKVMSPAASPRQYTAAEKARYATQVRIRNQTNANKKATANAELEKVREFYRQNGHLPTEFANESRNRFDDANAVDVGELGRQVALGKLTEAQALDKVRGGTAGINDINRRAGLAASLEIDPKKAVLDAAIKRLNESHRSADMASEQAARVTAERQAAIYAALMKQMAEDDDQAIAQAGQTAQTVGAGFDAATGAIQGRMAQSNAASAAEAARLGLTEGAQTLDAQSAASTNPMLDALTNYKTGATTSIQNMGQAEADWSNAIRAATGIQGAQLQAQTQTDFAARRQAALEDKLNQESEFMGESAGLEAQRRPRLYEGIESLKEAQAAQQAEEQQAAFERYIAERTLGVKETDANTRQYSAQTERQRADAYSKKTMAELQKIQRESIPGTLEYESAVAAIGLKKAQAAAAVTNSKTNIQNANTRAQEVTNKAAADAAKIAPAANYGKGMPGVNNFLRASNVDDTTFAMVMKHVNNTIVTHDNGDYAGGLRGVEGYIAKHKLSPQIANIFRIATAIAYGKN